LDFKKVSIIDKKAPSINNSPLPLPKKGKKMIQEIRTKREYNN